MSKIVPCKPLKSPVKFQTHETTKDVFYVLTNGDGVTVPKGFRFDGRSSPYFLQWLFPRWNKSDYAWLLHDWLYVVDYKRDEWGWVRSKTFADVNMLARCLDDNPGRFYNWSFWDGFLSFLGVLFFGTNVYKKDRE